tara:strand:+ start:3557 stop:4255 length:699 start_codon:yes stop_codon:yes gene_type:complete
MDINQPSERLKSFWGKVDQKHINHIVTHVKGKRVLDMGAGYGTTAGFLHKNGYNATAFDLDDDSIAVSKILNPGLDYQKLNAENLPFKDGEFDTLILRDALHHFIGEADFSKIQSEMNRILKPGGNIIFFDPNVNKLILTLRKLSKHDDEETTYEEALAVFKDMNYDIVHKSYNTLFSLPLSGGYVGVNFIPNIPFLYTIILKLESFFELLVQNVIGRHLAWRYVIVGRKSL